MTNAGTAVTRTRPPPSGPWSFEAIARKAREGFIQENLPNLESFQIICYQALFKPRPFDLKAQTTQQSTSDEPRAVLAVIRGRGKAEGGCRKGVPNEPHPAKGGFSAALWSPAPFGTVR